MSLSVKAKDAAKSNGLPASPEISAEDVPF
jgi:hypothetical protein